MSKKVYDQSEKPTRKEIAIGIVLVIMAIVMLLADIVVLPQQVIVQIGINALPSGYMPKYLVVAITFIVSFIGGLMYIFCTGAEKHRFLSLSLIGIAVSLISLIFSVS